jgi:hypothetical protein
MFGSLLPLLASGGRGPIVDVVGWLFGSTSALAALSLVPVAISHTRLHQMTKALKRFQTSDNEFLRKMPPSTIGMLLEITVWGARAQIDTSPTDRWLAALLNSITSEDEVYLTEQQRTLLHELVVPKYWEYGLDRYPIKAKIFQRLYFEVRPVAIEALGILGNRSSIRVLEKFAQTTDYPTLRQFAFRSIEQIQERLQYGSEQMLRASRHPQQAEQPDTLLRATSNMPNSVADPDQLLRADITPMAQTRQRAGSNIACQQETQEK